MALKILCFLSLLAFCHARVLPTIVNGNDAKPGEIPYQVSLQRKYYSIHFCGGSILNDYYVITAAHCVDGRNAKDIKVVAGTINLTQPKSEHNVVRIIIHEEYNAKNSWINDIALLKTDRSFEKFERVLLPPKGYVVKPNDIAVMSGWGRLWEGGPTTVKLQRVNILIADQIYCKYIYNNIGYNVHPTQVCAYDPSIEKGSCQGDSGGPLTVDGKLVGLVSWAEGCSGISYPTVCTRVASYLDWINTQLARPANITYRKSFIAKIISILKTILKQVTAFALFFKNFYPVTCIKYASYYL
ncbi:chymotrypsin-2-like [Monomorium pharaonis]|uniref:chymotrypsin-2-like n=1 Tax=Monomorium pharaonis TaxID=307658 RepID=UPI00063F82E7|nr:chymotrypsin-2-like [Monomorium pharaonis]XP_036138261.1 chymotrypsin-2-like [Monomorium pharaonis]